MELVPIFAQGDDLDQWPLWALDEGHPDGNVLDILLNEWTDTDAMERFFAQHADLLQGDFWRGISPCEAALQAIAEGELLEDRLLEASDAPNPQLAFNQLFEPFHSTDTEAEKYKARKARAIPKPSRTVLRIFALQFLDDKLLIISGGIKLTKDNEGSKELLRQPIQKMKTVAEWLRKKGITDIGDYYIYGA